MTDAIKLDSQPVKVKKSGTVSEAIKLDINNLPDLLTVKEVPLSYAFHLSPLSAGAPEANYQPFASILVAIVATKKKPLCGCLVLIQRKEAKNKLFQLAQ